jgi:coenzyme F420-0:L-glutamate ligase/coenzyme F420-1:gamma-L-glutamate ligase
MIVPGFADARGGRRRAPVTTTGTQLEFGRTGLSWVVESSLVKFAFFLCWSLEKFGRRPEREGTGGGERQNPISGWRHPGSEAQSCLKAEGALIALDPFTLQRFERARRYGLDARVTELALRESRRVVRRTRGVLITETRHGFICANSGVDVSNVDGGRQAALLPKDADRSAAHLRRELKKSLGLEIAVIVSDSFGRPWREGLTEVAIGVAGMRPLVDYRGRRDAHGYQLHASIDAVADELACAAGLVCGKLASIPVCIIRGFSYRAGNGTAREMIRPAAQDLFR